MKKGDGYELILGMQDPTSNMYQVSVKPRKYILSFSECHFKRFCKQIGQNKCIGRSEEVLCVST